MTSNRPDMVPAWSDGMRKHPFSIFALLMAGLGAFFIQVAPSRALEGTEYQIKGAMMVNFIKSETYRARSILDRVAGTPVLTIGEADGFTRLGGMIRFFLGKSHARFEINPDAAAHASLKFNAKLLEIARLME